MKISPPVAIVLVIVTVGLVLFFGFRAVSGGPDADVTQQVIKHYGGGGGGAAAPAGSNSGGRKDSGSGAAAPVGGASAPGAKRYN